MAQPLLAAVDLGSNSFRLQVGRVVDDQIYPLDSLKETVRLAAGLTAQKRLDGASQQRALAALARFGERLRGFDAGAVRAVATDTLRVARNAAQFLVRAEAALGFPIEIIAGREEARLIHLGIAHAVPDPRRQQLMVDIGGGSTEFIIGRGFEPLELASLYMGCVGFSLRHFPSGRADKAGFKAAELAARKELQSIVRQFRATGWQAAVGSSGTARALAEILEANGLSPGGVSRGGLERLRGLLLRAGDLRRLDLPGLRPERIPVLPGGLAIMLAVFREFGLEHMDYADGGLRLGVLHDLLGRTHQRDQRNATVRHFLRRYQADLGQAARVAASARGFLRQLLPGEEAQEIQLLEWAALLHEIGLSVAHSGYHRHGAYVLAHADMPGFSKMDQARLSRLVFAHRGKLDWLGDEPPGSNERLLVLSLRLAAILHRSRDDTPPPAIVARRTARGFALAIDADSLAALPLTAAALEEEARQWAALDVEVRIRAGRGRQPAAA
ncbi:MAG TPA: exopolyphosphatase [Candidatus Desulfobacillus sp.]|nr:exopolyphosphatase [Candidatus Desulfobacillus sp.]